MRMCCQVLSVRQTDNGFLCALQLYDAVAGTQGLTLSRYVTPSEALRQFPTLSPSHEDGKTLKGTVRRDAHHASASSYTIRLFRPAFRPKAQTQS